MTQIKSYTDIEQSKKLAEFIPCDTADFCWGIDDKTLHYNKYPYPMPWKDYSSKENYVPCWTLAALIDVLPKNIKSSFGEINPFVGQVGIKDYRCVYLYGDWCSDIQTFAKNPIDACYAMVLKLHELNLLS